MPQQIKKNKISFRPYKLKAKARSLLKNPKPNSGKNIQIQLIPTPNQKKGKKLRQLEK